MVVILGQEEFVLMADLNFSGCNLILLFWLNP